MTQLEIQFFWPLSEQIPLALDYSGCDKPKVWTTTGSIGSSGSFLTSGAGLTTWSQPQTIQFKPTPNSVGYWKVGDGLQMHNKKRPNWLNQKMTKLFFGWEWQDESPLQ